MNRKIIKILICSIFFAAAGVFLPFSKSVAQLSPNNSTFSLIKSSPNARSGDILITQNENGLLVKGNVDGEKPKWPEKATDDMANYDHIELWITDSQNLKLPNIGWGNQFDNETLNSEKDCDNTKIVLGWKKSDFADCKIWFRDQVKYRQKFKKLFVRQWQLAPNVAKETYSLEAYNYLSSEIQKKLNSLQPIIDPTIKVSEDITAKPGYDFEIEIPWGALPPINSLNLKNIKILIDIFSPGSGHLKYGPYSSISGKHNYGDISEFKIFKLPKPREYYITSCKYDLKSDMGNLKNYNVIKDDIKTSNPDYSAEAVPYILPGDNLNIGQILIIDNAMRGYQYLSEEPSPTVYEENFFEKNIQTGETICGPKLSYIKNSKIIKTDYSIDSKGLEVKHLSDNLVLVKSGPYIQYSYYGSGQGGGKPMVNLDIYYLDLKSHISAEAYSFYKSEADKTRGPEDDIDFKISSDWKKITNYDGKEEYKEDYKDSFFSWSSTNYCFNNKTHLYDKCGQNDKAKPPSPRIFNDLYGK